MTSKKRTLIIICTALFILLSNELTFGQSKILWEKKWTTANQASGLTTSKDGNAVAVGSVVSSRSGRDIAFSIIDPSGKLLTDTVIVGGNGDDAANAVAATDDGGYLLAGFTQSPRRGQSGKRDAWLLKTDETGKPLWDW
jgi:hypothetical protein